MYILNVFLEYLVEIFLSPSGTDKTYICKLLKSYKKKEKFFYSCNYNLEDVEDVEIFTDSFIVENLQKLSGNLIFIERTFDMATNANLHKAKEAKNDEFYTQLTDVSKELMHYKEHFKDKIVFCNCDDPTWSAFWKYFHPSFQIRCPDF